MLSKGKNLEWSIDSLLQTAQRQEQEFDTTSEEDEASNSGSADGDQSSQPHSTQLNQTPQCSTQEELPGSSSHVATNEINDEEKLQKAFQYSATVSLQGLDHDEPPGAWTENLNHGVFANRVCDSLNKVMVQHCEKKNWNKCRRMIQQWAIDVCVNEVANSHSPMEYRHRLAERVYFVVKRLEAFSSSQPDTSG